MIEEKLERILSSVRRPIRYVGGEYNLLRKEYKRGDILFALIYPDLYEIGMSHYGLKILYHTLNQREDTIAERAYAPWVDFAQKLKEENIPLYSLESKRPLREFHILGFSLQSELNYTNILYILDLAHIPLLSEERGPEDPLIIAGGPCATNPLPLKRFIDAFCIGDGEAILGRLIDVYKEWNRRDRGELLRLISQIPGVWVPLIGGEVKRQIVEELREEDFPYPPLLPISEITHDRLTVEIARGCTQGCRFCQAGMINRPLRFRSPEEVARLAERGIRSTGWEEVSLLSLSALDYPQLLPLIDNLVSTLEGRRIAISLPSMRGDSFSYEIAGLIRTIRKTGLTFAPETGSERLRRLINKPLKEEAFFKNLSNIFSLGWQGVKLYFMLGLPQEKWEDLESTLKMIKEATRIPRRGFLKFNIASFIPKPHTPFQWVKFESIESLKEKFSFLKSRIPKRRVRVKLRRPEVSFIEAILTRGDERLGDVFLYTYKNNGIFQDWNEFFNFPLWMEAFEKLGIEPQEYLRERKIEESLPWDFVNVGVEKDFLKREYKKGLRGEPTPDCMRGPCSKCGVCETPPDFSFLYKERPPTKIRRRIPSLPPLKMSIRIKYTVSEKFRYASHLDRIRAIYRALRRSELPIAYTRGFSPKPIVSFGPPLSVGLTSKGEYLDLTMAYSYSGNITRDLNPFLPHGLSIVSSRLLPQGVASLGSSINLLEYRVILDRPFSLKDPSIPALYKIEKEDENIFRFMLRIDPPVHLTDILKELLKLKEEEERGLRMERIDCYILKGGRIYTPLEVL